MSADRHYRSILRQTDWPCGLFHFGKAEQAGTVYFNPGLVERSDGLWLVTRKSVNHPGITIGMNSLMAFRLDSHLAPMYGHPLRMLSRFPNEHFEDARVIQIDDHSWVSCSNFIVFPKKPKEVWTGCQITLQKVDANWQAVQRFDPQYGHNRDGVRTAHEIEKNWLWFWHKGLPHLVYRAQPNRVVQFDVQNRAFVPINEWSQKAPRFKWRWGEVRGGTPPVLLGDEYWTFFHSSLPLENKYRRRYYMGLYTFQAHSPFKLLYMTSKPLLVGSDEDIWAESKPLVVFPGGATHRVNEWVVVGGCNDLKCFWIKIPHLEITKLLTRVC